MYACECMHAHDIVCPHESFHGPALCSGFFSLLAATSFFDAFTAPRSFCTFSCHGGSAFFQDVEEEYCESCVVAPILCPAYWDLIRQKEKGHSTWPETTPLTRHRQVCVNRRHQTRRPHTAREHNKQHNRQHSTEMDSLALLARDLCCCTDCTSSHVSSDSR